jgi:transaldolase
MTVSRLQALNALGQSVWLDDIDRGLLDDGTLARMIENDGVTGVTSNPSIFEKALAAARDYADAIAQLAASGNEPPGIADLLMRQDVARAADILRPVYGRTQGADGYVSIEVSPRLAHDAAATIAEAEYLWAALNRPNVMIKVPGTTEGLQAIERLTAAGVNVNVTLLFSVARYVEVAQAYLQGLKERAKDGKPIDNVASVASFFVSRIDTLVDRRLEHTGDSGAVTLRGQAAVACAQLAYREFMRMQNDTVWLQLTALGARPQRLLWASTSTKDPAYSDIRYVDLLVGPQTVNTMTRKTMAAYRDHGEPKVRIEDGLAQAEVLVARLATYGIDMDEIAAQLEGEGVRRFAESAEAVRERMRQIVQRLHRAAA